MQKCPSCGKDNPEYSSHCLQCATILRDRVPNLDFWNIFWQIVDSPKASLTKVIQSERKNFIFFLLIIIALKVSINSQYVYIHACNHEAPHPSGVFGLYGISLMLWLLLIAIVYLSLRFTSTRLRLKDIAGVVGYSHLPIVATFFFLFVPQFILWGPFLFTNSPSPFLIYKTLALFFTALEAASLLWSLWLLSIGLGILISNKVLRYMVAVLLFFFLHGLPIIYLLIV